MKILGVAILLAVFAFLFVVTAGDGDYVKAAMEWGMSIGLTGLIFLSVHMIVG